MILEIATDFTGIGSFTQALKQLGIKYKTIFACDNDKYARQTYCANFGTKKDFELSKMPALGFFDNDYSFYFPQNVYNRSIPKKPLDVYVTTPPCQGFSMAGKRGGSVLFLNSHNFIKINKPKVFIFENVKGLLSHDKKNKKAQYGNTFNQWISYLGGKSVNGLPVIFPHKKSVPYHIYYQVLNSKNYGVPQNRERVFIIGIRADQNNSFTFPKPFHLTKTLSDVLEAQVDEKYYLSEKMVNHLTKHERIQQPATEKSQYANCITASYHKQSSDIQYIKVNSATKKGYELAGPGDGINYININSDTKRGRVGKGTAQTLDTKCRQAVIVAEKPKTLNHQIRRLTPRECMRLMGFPDTYKMPCSDTQMYKQAGNSVVVNMYALLIKKLNL